MKKSVLKKIFANCECKRCDSKEDSPASYCQSYALHRVLSESKPRGPKCFFCPRVKASHAWGLYSWHGLDAEANGVGVFVCAPCLKYLHLGAGVSFQRYADRLTPTC